MFYKMLTPLVLISVLSGCSLIQHKEPLDIRVEKSFPDQKTEVPKVELNLPVPNRPELINDLQLYECSKDNRKFVCAEPEKFKGHLKDLTEIYRYQLQLESTLESYMNFYEPKK